MYLSRHVRKFTCLRGHVYIAHGYHVFSYVSTIFIFHYFFRSLCCYMPKVINFFFIRLCWNTSVECDSWFLKNFFFISVKSCLTRFHWVVHLRFSIIFAVLQVSMVKPSLEHIYEFLLNDNCQRVWMWKFLLLLFVRKSHNKFSFCTWKLFYWITYIILYKFCYHYCFQIKNFWEIYLTS